MAKEKRIEILDWDEVIGRCVWAVAENKDGKTVDLCDEDVHEICLYTHTYGPGLPDRRKWEKGLFEFAKVIFDDGEEIEVYCPPGVFKVVSATSGHFLTKRFDDEMVNYEDDSYSCMHIKRVK